jgi:hypothetical protein
LKQNGGGGGGDSSAAAAAAAAASVVVVVAQARSSVKDSEEGGGEKEDDNDDGVSPLTAEVTAPVVKEEVEEVVDADGDDVGYSIDPTVTIIYHCFLSVLLHLLSLTFPSASTFLFVLSVVAFDFFNGACRTLSQLWQSTKQDSQPAVEEKESALKKQKQRRRLR